MAWQCDYCLLVLDDDPHFDAHLRIDHSLNHWRGDPLDLWDFGTAFDEETDDDEGWVVSIVTNGHRPV